MTLLVLYFSYNDYLVYAWVHGTTSCVHIHQKSTQFESLSGRDHVCFTEISSTPASIQLASCIDAAVLMLAVLMLAVLMLVSIQERSLIVQMIQYLHL